MMKQHFVETPELLGAWKEKPEIIRQFLSVRPMYEQLCNEVAYILNKKMIEENIEFSAVTHRAKTLNSFAEKINRKQYDNPFLDITDFAGVRVVYLYSNDLEAIIEIIKSEFEIIEIVDKMKGNGIDKFGYGAMHFLVQLGNESSGARYDDLKELMCEIQVRTVLQDAWAIIDHHLVYKQEKDVPNFLIRKLNSLAGLFEIADNQFEMIRDLREGYLKDLSRESEIGEIFLKLEVNLDTVAAFIKWHFPEYEKEPDMSHISNVLSDLNENKYGKLSDIHDVLLRTEKARDAYRTKEEIISPVAEIAIAVGFDDHSYREEGWIPESLDLLYQYENLVEKW